MPQSFQRLEIRSQLEHLQGARRFVRDFCERDTCRRFGWVELWQLELAVHEAATNIIRHAYQNRANQRILIEIQGFEERVMVHLNHWGKPFTQPKPSTPPVLDGTGKCGFGLYLIERCVDKVIYECTPDGKNIITLLKLRNRVTSVGPPGIQI